MARPPPDILPSQWSKEERGSNEKGSTVNLATEQILIDDLDKLLQRHCLQLARRLEARQHELLERLAAAYPSFEPLIPVLEEEEEEELPEAPNQSSQHRVHGEQQKEEDEEPHAATALPRGHRGRGRQGLQQSIVHREERKEEEEVDGSNEFRAIESAPTDDRVRKRSSTKASSAKVSFFSNEQVRQQLMREIVKDEGRARSSFETPRPDKGVFRERLAKFVNSCCFEGCSCFLIFASVIFFGVETEYMAQNRIEVTPAGFVPFSRVFSVIFLLELVLHVIVEGRSFLTSEFWFSNVMDVIIVIATLVEIGWDLLVDQDGNTTNLTHIRVIRLVRIIRILRVVSIMKFFRSLRIMVCSVLNTLKSLLWVIFMILVIIYIFALLFTQAANEYIVEGVPQSDEVQQLTHYYGSLALSVYTLFKVITGGLNWELAADPLQSIGLAWMLIFTAFVAFNFLALLNVVMGLVCQTAIESAQHDLDVVVQTQLSYQEEYTRKFKDLFKNIDLQDTGILTLSDLEERLQDPKLKDYFAAMDLTTTEAWSLFKLLDANNSCEIDVDEFVTGCLRLRGNARSIDMHMLMYESKWMLKQLANVVRALKKQECLLEERFDHRSDSSKSGGAVRTRATFG